MNYPCLFLAYTPESSSHTFKTYAPQSWEPLLYALVSAWAFTGYIYIWE